MAFFATFCPIRQGQNHLVGSYFTAVPHSGQNLACGEIEDLHEPHTLSVTSAEQLGQ
jgi:hypothetical protein